jgi:hypothetical protein
MCLAERWVIAELPALDHPSDDCHGREDQQDVEESAHRVRCCKPEDPEENQNDGYRDEHIGSFWQSCCHEGIKHDAIQRENRLISITYKRRRIH